MQRKRMWVSLSIVLIVGVAVFLLLSVLPAYATIVSVTHTTVADFNAGSLYLTGLTQQEDGEVTLLRIGVSGNWTSTMATGLPPVFGHTMVENNGWLYVIGGDLGGSPNQVLTRSIYAAQINPQTNAVGAFTWKGELPPTLYPNGVFMHSSVVVSNGVGNYLYVMGGVKGQYIQPGDFITQVVFAPIYSDGSLGAWQPAAPLPYPRGRAPAVQSNGFIYLPGGQIGSTATSTVIYAGPTIAGMVTSWQTTTNLPYSQYGHMATAYNNRLYVMGGTEPGKGVEPYVYFATTLTTTGGVDSNGWLSTTVLQGGGVYAGVGLAFNGELFTFGGFQGSGSPSPTASPYASAALIDFDSGYLITYTAGQSWYSSPALDPPRFWHAGTTSSDHRFVYVVGGTYNGNSPVPTGTLNIGQTTGEGSSAYAKSGWYAGPQIELGLDRLALGFSFTVDLPNPTVTTTLQYRTALSKGAQGLNWGLWSAGIAPAGTVGRITTTVDFAGTPDYTNTFGFQYRVWMTTTPPYSYTPSFHQLTLSYDVPSPPDFVKHADPPSGQGVLNGQRITYTISFSNVNDLSTLRDVYITDTVPSWLDLDPTPLITATPGIVIDASGLPQVRWNVGNLPPHTGGSMGFAGTVRMDAQEGELILNQARFFSKDVIPYQDSNSTVHTVAALYAPMVTKTASPPNGSFVLAGQRLTYTLTYSNPNQGLTLASVLTDTLPPQADPASLVCNPACDFSGNQVKWQFTSDPLTQFQAQFSVVIVPGLPAGTVITNAGYGFGCVTAVNACTPVQASNSVTHTVASLQLPSLSKDATPPGGTQVLQGSSITYRLTYTNSDSLFALTDMVVTDALPSGVQFVNGSCTPACTLNGNVLTWHTGPLAPAQSGQVTFAATVNQSVPGGTQLVNTGYASSCVAWAGQCTAVVPSNSITHTVKIGPTGVISKSANPLNGSIVGPGDKITYILNYSNPNSSPLASTVINDPIPANTTFVSCTGGCSLVGGVARWTLGTVAAGGSGQVQLVVQVTQAAPDRAVISNQATITTDGGSTSSETVSHTVIVPYDLQLTKTVNLTATIPGSTFTYTVAFTNQGALTLSGVVVTDDLGFVPQGQPSGSAIPYLTPVQSTPGWQLVQHSTAGDIYRYTVGSLGPYQSGALTMVFKLANTIPYTVNRLDNHAVIVDDGTHGRETNPSNQAADVWTPIQGPDLAFSNARIVSGQFKPGGLYVFTLAATIVNRGLTGTLTWEHRITDTIGNNWLAIELYTRPTSLFAGPPSGPNDHAGGLCAGTSSPCPTANQRWSFVQFEADPLGLAPGETYGVSWPVTVTASGGNRIYVQVDTGYWWQYDPTYGRVLEYDELNNIADLGVVPRTIYLPVVLRK